MGLALFDLDHTLIPFDSGMAWVRHGVALGLLPPEAEAVHLAHCQAYVDGTLDIHAMHRALLRPLAALAPAALAGWQSGFAATLPARLPAAAQALVRQHQAAGDLCAIVTATERIIAEPFAQAFGIAHLIATEACLDADGRPTGEIDGLPCWRTHKCAAVEAWLARLGQPPLAHWADSVFYSDSVSDLPLLQAVRRPMAVHPDARLREIATDRGWPILALT